MPDDCPDEEGAITDPGRPAGRPPATTLDALSHAALGLFLERGFEATTVDDVAAAAGVGRRTLFRYVASKNDLVWGDFESLLGQMRERLDAMPADRSVAACLRVALVEFNRFPAAELPFHRRRMELLLTVPTLVAHSTLRYAAWRGVVADFVARRLGLSPEDLTPRTAGWVLLAVSLAAYEQWLADDGADLADLLQSGLDGLDGVLGP